MEKWQKEAKEKKTMLTANPTRQANDPLRGYRYQILHSVKAWLDLAEGEILYLEGVEDFDIVSDDATTLVQVKDTQRKITLRSQEVNDAINHYWEFWTQHRDLTVKFRFITRSKIGTEQGNPFGNNQQGIRLWNRCSDHKASITKISEFLRTKGKISEEVKSFLKQADSQEIYEQLIEPITWETDSKPASSIEQSISEKLVNHGHEYKISASYAKNVLEVLLNEAFTVATQKEDRELTKARFLEIFEEKTTVRVPFHQYIQAQQTPSPTPVLGYIKATFDYIKAALIGNSPDVTIQPHSPIQTDIPPLHPDIFRRTALLTSIQVKLQSDGIAVIQGGVDKGKTTLAKLIANDINGSWLWLNFTNREPVEVVQLLQQLDIAVSGQSSQVNVVLDDLNLQPKQLRTYKEDLEVVVYRVLERDAKLLITSQHKPPKNFIRSLGLSSPVVVHVPNFTIPEIEQFARQLGCPAEKAKSWAELFQLPTRRHPRLVHALLTQLRKNGWKRQDVIESILQTPPELAKELEEAQQLLADLPEDQQEFLYRLSLMCTEFRKDYALNIGEIPEIIPYPGRVFDQLVDPWMDQVDKTYYALSPLLNNAAEQVWSESKINRLHVEVANAILKAKDLTNVSLIKV